MTRAPRRRTIEQAPAGKADARPPRRRLSREDRQASLIEAAFAEFVQKGYAAARLKDIAQRAGAAQGLLNFYFESKEKLFQAVVRQYLAPNLLGEIEHSLQARAGSAEDLLRDVIGSIYRRMVMDPRAREIMRLIIAEAPKFPELGQVYHDHMAGNVRIIRDVIQRGVEQGEFRPDSIEQHSRVVHAPYAAAMMWAMIIDEQMPFDMDGWIRSHLDLVLRGLRSPTKATDDDVAGV